MVLRSNNEFDGLYEHGQENMYKVKKKTEIMRLSTKFYGKSILKILRLHVAITQCCHFDNRVTPSRLICLILAHFSILVLAFSIGYNAAD